MASYLSWLGSNWKIRLRYATIAMLVLFLAIPWPGLFYELRVKKGRGEQALLTLPFIFRHTFDLSYTHSIYLVPVREKYEAEGSAIHLREIFSQKWVLEEYYRIPGTLQQEEGEIRLRDIRFKVFKLPLMIGFTGTQRLTWRDRVYALYEMSPPGGVLTIEALSISPGRYLWEKAKERLRLSAQLPSF